MLHTRIQEHIELIAKHEEDFLAQRTPAERASDAIAAFVGSFTFVGFHLTIFAVWILWNLLPRTSHFDPAPFSLLGTVIALEGILLASVILMRQARMSRRSEERDHLMLQLLLLTEREVTAALNLDRQIAKQLGLDRAAANETVRELSRETPIGEIADSIKETLPEAP